jgi:DNA-binding NtrC family response regulator
MNKKNDYPGLPKALSLLIVEDEPRLRELLADVAPDMGFTPAVGVATGEEALRLMEAAPRDVALIDLNLPAMDGLELFGRIRQRWPATQVIILTGFGSLEAAKSAIHLDVVEFLTKPCPLNKVEEALARARRRIDEQRQRHAATPSTPTPAANAAAPLAEVGDAAALVPKAGETLEAHERQVILAALERNGGNRTATAIELGISRRTLHYRLQAYQKLGFLAGGG